MLMTFHYTNININMNTECLINTNMKFEFQLKKHAQRCSASTYSIGFNKNSPGV